MPPDEDSSAEAALSKDNADAEATHDKLEMEDEGRKDTAESQRPDLQASIELTPPPLPPRPSILKDGSVCLSSRSTATTALSLADVQTQTNLDIHNIDSKPSSRAPSRKPSSAHLDRLRNANSSDFDDSASLKSFVPTLDLHHDEDSALGENIEDDSSSVLKYQISPDDVEGPFRTISPQVEMLCEQIRHEFDGIESNDYDGANEDLALTKWKSKLKHFIILSASGKPIYSRHGDDQLTSHYVGVAQTIISFYQSTDDVLRGFCAGDTRFAVLSKGPLNLLAITRLGESDAQLRTQLESLYMQILSTLTLSAMEKMFSSRPSTDLRRPLQGTDVLLDGLADGFTRGSPSTLLSALECLRLRKTQRKAINEILLKVRSPNLLYGLIVAAGRLVSVVRPKKHSLHPGDLHLIFNMLFEAGSVKAGGGENWIPLCLPGFNNTGYLYMYVSFFSATESRIEPVEIRPTTADGREEELAIVLISTNKEAFYELRKMRDDLVSQLESAGSMAIIKSAIRKGHASCSEIVPQTVISHFLYKSRGNVQFVMPSFAPEFQDAVLRRRLITLYHQLHESIHSKTAHLKVQHCVSSDSTALAWETPLFELYCVAGPQADRAALIQGANRIVQWIRREEERVFIIGGAVF